MAYECHKCRGFTAHSKKPGLYPEGKRPSAIADRDHKEAARVYASSAVGSG